MANEDALRSGLSARRPREIDTSVVVPMYNEAESVPFLVEQVRAALTPLRQRFELILVDDGSSDNTWEVIESLRAGYPFLVGIRLKTNRGQTPALMAGFDASRGAVVVTLDGDLQNDPADIPLLLNKLDEGFEIVSGWRKARQDRLLSRRFPSVVANWITRRLTGVSIHDNGCALKAYRGDVLRSVALYSDFHRFIVPLAQMGGARVGEVVTHHRARQFGQSKYGISRTFRVLADLATLYMVTRYSEKLLHWFLVFAIPVIGLSIVCGIWTWHVMSGTMSGTFLVPIGASVLCFQSAASIFGYGLFAEKIRLLAPERGRRGQRLLARVIYGGSGETVLIREGQAIPIRTSFVRS